MPDRCTLGNMAMAAIKAVPCLLPGWHQTSRRLAEKDLGGAPDEELVSPLRQLLDELRAVQDATRLALERRVNAWTSSNRV